MEKSYRVIAISMYPRDIAAVDRQVRDAKRLGWSRANRSALIRVALQRLDVESLLLDQVAQRRATSPAPAKAPRLEGVVTWFDDATWWGHAEATVDEKTIWAGRFHAMCFLGATPRNLPRAGQRVTIIFADESLASVFSVEPRADPVQDEAALAAKLAELRQLPIDWGGSVRPSPVACDTAAEVVRGLSAKECAPEGLTPIADGGVSIVFPPLAPHTTVKATIDIYNNGRCVVGIRERGLVAQYIELAAEESVALVASFCARKRREFGQPASCTTDAETPAADPLP